ncbi:sensor histidine kinase [Polyangium fumosum]|uniref:histidine kinase n=1 Tax=Polyangium fumosum TaxID=889272 RepID=A0A4U1J8Z2_9BACT|nr:HAMP domain-containing sensor histidine kinase [Polyangium fumosum]TKD04457.1 HAMP domain-containing histidine kinase [Polyangium fumosum]
MTTASDPNDRDARAAALAIAGALGAGVAHELRNTLAAIESALYLARRHAEDRARLGEHLARAENEVRKGQAVIDRVLALARGEPLDVEPASVAEIVACAERELFDVNATIEVRVAPPDLEVVCDRILIERVIANLLLNARDALEGRARGRIVVRALASGEAVVVDVEDDGPGIDPEIAPRIFEPSVTSKPTGTGLGLALCRIIAHAHGGTVEALGAPSGGALFRLTLPAKRAS